MRRLLSRQRNPAVIHRYQKKAAAQLVFKGAVPSVLSSAAYMNSWTKEENDNDLKTTFIQGKKKAKGEEPEGITAVDDEMYNELSGPTRKADAVRNRKCESRLEISYNCRELEVCPPSI